jgi:hypothetical protein
MTGDIYAAYSLCFVFYRNMPEIDQEILRNHSVIAMDILNREIMKDLYETD